MFGSPFRFESRFTDAEYQKLGLLALRWSHTEHIVGNCLKLMLRLSDDEAVAVVFSISTTQRLQLIRKLADLKPMNKEATKAFEEFDRVWAKIQYVRNTVIHAIIDESGAEPKFHLRSGKRSINKDDVFSVEELTNYAAHAAHAFRFALGLKGAPDERHQLPERPAIPAFLASVSPSKATVPKSRPSVSKKVSY
jgi:hypothetical protein